MVKKQKIVQQTENSKWENIMKKAENSKNIEKVKNYYKS